MWTLKKGRHFFPFCSLCVGSRVSTAHVYFWCTYRSIIRSIIHLPVSMRHSILQWERFSTSQKSFLYAAIMYYNSLWLLPTKQDLNSLSLSNQFGTKKTNKWKRPWQPVHHTVTACSSIIYLYLLPVRIMGRPLAIPVPVHSGVHPRGGHRRTSTEMNSHLHSHSNIE